MTPDETRAFMAMIMDLYPNAQFSEDAPEAWHRFLAPFPATAVETVFFQVSKEEPRFPPTAMQMAHALNNLVKPSEPSADEAWDLLVKAGIRFGAGEAHRVRAWLDNARISDALAAIGGWHRFATTDYRDHNTMRAQFKAAYALGGERANVDRMRQVLGMASGTNVPALEEGEDDGE